MKEIRVTRGSGNVFADLGYPNPQEHQTKASLVSQIADIIDDRQLTHASTAELLGVDQPKIFALLNGQFRGFSVYRLMSFIAALLVPSAHFCRNASFFRNNSSRA